MFKEEFTNIKTDTSTLRKFGLLLTVFLGILGGISLWKNGNLYPYLFAAALLILILSLAYPQALKFIYKPWMMVAIVIGSIVSHVILFILFYLVFTPVGLILRLTGKDLLDEKIIRDKDSYWIEREKTIFSREDLERQF